MVLTCGILLSLPLTGQRIWILKDGSIPCEHADFTAAVSLPGDVQCGLILIPTTSIFFYEPLL